MTHSYADVLSRPVVGGWRTLLPLAVSILLFGSGALLQSHDFKTLPRVPLPDQGRTYPLENHRIIVYGTLADAALFHGVFIAGFAAGAVGIRNEQRSQERMNSKTEPS